jgi:glycosyltransferase involved in cell wall biosynthesis
MLAQARRWDLVRLLTTSADEAARSAAHALTWPEGGSLDGAANAIAAVVAPHAHPWDALAWTGASARAGWAPETTARLALEARDRRRYGSQRSIVEIAGGMQYPSAGTHERAEPSRVVPYLVHEALPQHNTGYTLRTHAVASELLGLGWDLRVLPNPYRARETRPGVRWHDGVRYDMLEVASADDFEDMLRVHAAALQEYIHQSGAAVVMAASNYRNGLVASRAAKATGIPFVYEVRGFWELSRAAAEPSWRGSDEFSSLIRMETSVAKAADVVVTLAESMADELTARGIDRGKIVVARNGAPVIAREKAAPKDAHGALRVVYAGALVQYEGLDVLLRATARTRRSGACIEVHVIGGGPDLERLESIAAKLGLTACIQFYGRLPPGAAADLVRSADLFVLPRVSTEVTDRVPSLKPLEAMSAGIPTVVTALAPNLEYYGSAPVRLVPPGDVDALADVLEEGARRDVDLIRLGEEGRRWQVAGATWRRTAEQLGETYDRLLRMNRN